MRTATAFLVFAVLVPLAARADHGLPNWVFTGEVVSVNDGGDHLGLTIGDPASGRIVWWTGMNQVFNGATAAFYQETANYTLGVGFHLGGISWNPQSSANVTLQVHDDHATFDDRFSLSDAALVNNGGLTYSASGVSLLLLDEDRTIFSDTSIPATLPPLSEYESATMNLTLTNVDGTSDSATVIVDLLTLEEEVHAVPAVSPMGLFGLAMLLAALPARVRSRRDRQRE